MPIDPPLRVKIAVLMPISRPSWVTSAPPELPGLIAASVWINGRSGAVVATAKARPGPRARRPARTAALG
jgi:hypothetical protein